jgi:hypothetical protein
MRQANCRSVTQTLQQQQQQQQQAGCLLSRWSLCVRCLTLCAISVLKPAGNAGDWILNFETNGTAFLLLLLLLLLLPAP